jgi:hypothetical protein
MDGIDAVRSVALTRCVVNTLGVPFVITAGLAAWCAFWDYRLGHMSRLRFGVWSGLILVFLLVAVLLVYRFLESGFTTYRADEIGVFPN